MTEAPSGVIGGVDTHKHSHRAAVIDSSGELIGDRGFSTDAEGEGELLAWLRSQGRIAAVGVEGTGSYGASLARRLASAGVGVVEVNRPNRTARRANGNLRPARRRAGSQRGPGGDRDRGSRGRVGTGGGDPRVAGDAFKRRESPHAGVPCAARHHDRLCGGVARRADPTTKRTLVNRCAAPEPETEDLMALIGQPDRLQLATPEQALRDLAK